MDTNEDFIAKNIILYTIVGLGLRFVLYGFPRIDLVMLYVILSLMVGFGGGAIAWGRKIGNQRIYTLGILVVLIGLLPLHYLL